MPFCREKGTVPSRLPIGDNCIGHQSHLKSGAAAMLRHDIGCAVGQKAKEEDRIAADGFYRQALLSTGAPLGALRARQAPREHRLAALLWRRPADKGTW